MATPGTVEAPPAPAPEDAPETGTLVQVSRVLNVIRTWAFGESEVREERSNSFLEHFGYGAASSLSSSAHKKTDNKETTDAPKGNCAERIVDRLHALFTLLCSAVIQTTSVAYFRWIALLSLLTFYNLIVLILRAVFLELQEGHSLIVWMAIDYLIDAVFLADNFVGSRTGYLEQGLPVRDLNKLWLAYTKRSAFKLDLLSIVPLDLLYFLPSLGPRATWLRLNRLAKMHRVLEFFTQIETRINFPNMFRIFSLILYILIIIHINGCIYFAICQAVGLGTDAWVYPPRQNDSIPPTVPVSVDAFYEQLHIKYIYSFYWSTLILTTIADTPGPTNDMEYIFMNLDFLVGVLIFVTIVGNVGSLVANMNATRNEFQLCMDNVKHYMEIRKVSGELQQRVVHWFDYLWSNKQSLNEASILSGLPDKLKAEIAMHVHYDTLKRVTLFQDCEPGLLVALMVKLKVQVFSPGDYICRKGDIGKEMYIVKSGNLGVVSDDGKKVFVTLKEGSVFGELSILNIPGNKTRNRRTANVRSMGYSDLFCLSKNDLWDALTEYPEAKKKLLQRGRDILAKDNLIDEEAIRISEREGDKIDDRVTRLDNNVIILQKRLARLLADFEKGQRVIKTRLVRLEDEGPAKLRKQQVAITKVRAMKQTKL